MNKYTLVLLLSLLCSCLSRTPSDQSGTILSMQIIDRNGFTETISNKERMATFQTTNFLTPQPFKKVLRVYGRNAAGQSSSKITSYHDNGELWHYLEAVDGRAHGMYQEWFSNGKQKIEATVVEGVADILDIAQTTWVFQGPCQVWDEQGALIATFNYEKGLLHAPARYFFKSGKLQKILPYNQGELQGTAQTFDEEGNLLEEIPYIRGEKHGEATLFWEPGQLLSRELYDHGRLQEASYFTSDGSQIAEVHEGHGKMAQFKEKSLSALFSITEGDIEGEVQFFHPNQTLYSSHKLKKGKKEGEEWEYYPSKKGEKLIPKLCVHWSDDQIQGQVRTWYPDGQLESQREISSNKKQGSAFAWYKDGFLMLMEEYENDLLFKGSYYKKGEKKAVTKVESGNGIATLYNSDGIFLKKVSYEKGKPITTDAWH
jgi:antitoxin component YwqK of YwqJK toxin-antitoxin module